MNHYFLILVDFYSQWIYVHMVPSIKTTVQTLRQIFSIDGLPEQLVSNNGPAFTSHEFKEFLQNNGIRHSLTAPYHPRSNRLAERTVQTFKTTMKKMEGPLLEGSLSIRVGGGNDGEGKSMVEKSSHSSDSSL